MALAVNPTSTTTNDATSSPSDGWTALKPFKTDRKDAKPSSSVTISRIDSRVENEDTTNEIRSDDELLGDESRPAGPSPPTYMRRSTEIRDDEVLSDPEEREEVVYKVYKRRWFGLIQLVLMNIIVSWDWLTFAPVSSTASTYFSVPISTINWLSTSFLFAFLVSSPLTIYTLSSSGPRLSLLTASILLLIGNWIRYSGTRTNTFGVVMFGQILTGLAQPFVLAAPTRYSELWFGVRGRVAATAVMSLANPFGGAVGQLIGPFWVDGPEDISNMVLYVTIISSLATLPSFFIPSRPPTPPAPIPTTHGASPTIRQSLATLSQTLEFWLIIIPYAIYVALFNALSSLLSPLLTPYAFTETSAGIAGALLILVGLLSAALTSPLIDKYTAHLLAIKLLVPVVGAGYLVLIWVVPGGGETGVYVLMSILGAASFSLVPVVLEFLVEITWPVEAGVTSTLCWCGGQALGGVFIVLETALMGDEVVGGGDVGNAGDEARWGVQRALVFQAVVAVVVVPLPLCLGWWGRGRGVRMRRGLEGGA